MGFALTCIAVLSFAQNKDCWYLLELIQRGVSNTQQNVYDPNISKKHITNLHLKNVILGVKQDSIILPGYIYHHDKNFKLNLCVPPIQTCRRNNLGSIEHMISAHHLPLFS